MFRVKRAHQIGLKSVVGLVADVKLCLVVEFLKLGGQHG